MNTLVRFSAVLIALIWMAQARAASPVQLVSTADANAPLPAGANGDSASAELSADGRFLAFVSVADNLVTNNSNGPVLDVYVRNLAAGTISLASVNRSGGSGGNGHSLAPVLSADGSTVVFQSDASDLVPDDTNGLADIFLCNLKSGETRLISTNKLGKPGNGPSVNPIITLDGRFIVFESGATDFVDGDTNNVADIFMHDVQTGAIRLVTVNAAGTGSAEPDVPSPSNSPAEISTGASVTPDGRFVVFRSLARNITQRLPADVNLPSLWQIFVRDMKLETNHLASVALNGRLGFRDSGNAVISSDGRYVAFTSIATNLVVGSTVSINSVFFRDLQSGTTIHVSPLNAAAPEEAADTLAMTADGKTVAFGLAGQVYLWDRDTRNQTLISSGLDGNQADGPSEIVSISDDGAKVVFTSQAGNLVTNATTGNAQIYLRDLSKNTTSLVSVNQQRTAGGSSDALFPTMSADGSVIAFEAFDSDFIESDFNNASDVFHREISDTQVKLASAREASRPSKTPSGNSTLVNALPSADGRFVLFATGEERQLHVKDLSSGTSKVVAVNRLGQPSSAPAAEPRLTSDGRFAAFTSIAGDLAEGDTNGVEDVFVRDLVSGETILVSANLQGTGAGNAASTSPAISDDGRFVAFFSRAGNLTREATPASRGVYLRDLQRKETRLLLDSGPTTPEISADGRFVAFGRSVSGPAPRELTIFDAVEQTAATASIGNSLNRLSMDRAGKFLAFETASSLAGSFVSVIDLASKEPIAQRPNLFPQLSGGSPRNILLSASGSFVTFGTPRPIGGNIPSSASAVYVLNITSKAISLVSVNLAGTGTGNGNSEPGGISSNGRFVIFSSVATDLVPGGIPPGPHIYVRDLIAGKTFLADINPAGQPGDGLAIQPLISADGGTAFFSSSASDLVEGDFNIAPDVFAFSVPQTDLSGSPDSDSDGLIDGWEFLHFGNLARDGKGDFDNDGSTDSAELLAGTDPTSPEAAASLKLAVQQGPTSLTITWKGQAGELFAVQSKSDLASPWTDLQSNLSPDASGNASFTAPFEGAARFFRVVGKP